MQVKIRSLAVGAATYLPLLRTLSGRRTGGTTSARYCYSVWLRHLCIAHLASLPTSFTTIVELGPGDSLGIGMAALISGASRYAALDTVRYAETQRNLQIFDQLVDLFRRREPIPDASELPFLQPRLTSYGFPHHILTAERLEFALDPQRLDVIRSTLRDPDRAAGTGKMIAYICPWQPDDLQDQMADLIISQSVLQYPSDLKPVYVEMARWLKPGGLMSHEIDFKSIGLTSGWNGHWTCSDALWRLVAGRRRHRINREPCSKHIALLKSVNCRVARVERTRQPSAIAREQLAPRFRSLDDEDLTTSSALIQSVKIG
ncbi:MAG TPA: methyltransferase domain-containing protein [Pseudolabrys sp.]|nr:methyltransferase domain-containing protein [Pseudolabrys sp.]